MIIVGIRVQWCQLGDTKLELHLRTDIPDKVSVDNDKKKENNLTTEMCRLGSVKV